MVEVTVERFVSI